MQYLIVDDEPLARKRLQQLLQSIQPDSKIIEAENGKQAIEQVAKNDVDMVFLDIRMPVMDGMEAAQHLSRLTMPPAIIFTTAYNEFAIKAFETQAIAYLLKPVSAQKLQQALQKANKVNIVQAKQLEPKTRIQHLTSKVGDKIKLIDINEVIYITSEEKYLWVIHQKGKDLIDDTIKNLQETLKENFIRVHRNALVAKKAILALVKKDGRNYLELQKGHKVEVSRRMLADVKARIKS